MTRPTYDWEIIADPRDKEAISESDYQWDEPMSGESALNAILNWHGYGMSANRLKSLYETYLKD